MREYLPNPKNPKEMKRKQLLPFGATWKKMKVGIGKYPGAEVGKGGNHIPNDSLSFQH